MPSETMTSEAENSAQIKKEISEGLYTPEDLEQWKKGAEDFQQFAEVLITSGEELENYWPNHVGPLKALFLGERAMSETKGFEKYSSVLDERFGIKTQGRIFYRPMIVEKTIDRYPEIFGQIIDTHAQDRVETLIAKVDSDGFNRYAIQVGLLLGYPRESVEAYAKTTQQEPHPGLFNDICGELMGHSAGLALDEIDEMNDPKKQIQTFLVLCGTFNIPVGVNEEQAIAYQYTKDRTQLVDVHGVVWANTSKPSPETIRKGQRLGAAFEHSGILNHFNPPELKQMKMREPDDPHSVAAREVRDRLRAILANLRS
jgi:hypothetical protein